MELSDIFVVFDSICNVEFMYSSKSDNEQTWGSNFEDGHKVVVYKNDSFFFRNPWTGIDSPTTFEEALNCLTDIYAEYKAFWV